MMMTSRTSFSTMVITFPISQYLTKRVGRSFLRDEAATQEEPPSPYLRLIVEPMALPPPGPPEVAHRVAPRRQELGDQAAVAALPRRLCAHEARRGLSELAREGLLPVGRAHPGGVAPEGGYPEAAEPLLTRFVSQPPAELDCAAVGDARGADGVAERLLVELRIPSRAREAAYVDEGLRARLLEHCHELLDRPRAVADRKNARYMHKIAASMVRTGGRWPES